jgi:hypothetical protein
MERNRLDALIVEPPVMEAIKTWAKDHGEELPK